MVNEKYIFKLHITIRFKESGSIKRKYRAMSHVTVTYRSGEVVEVKGGKGSGVMVVSRTLTGRFQERVHFHHVSLTGSLKTVCVSQDMLNSRLDQRSRLSISLQKQNVHAPILTALVELDDLRWLE